MYVMLHVNVEVEWGSPFHVYAWPFMHCLCFINTQKIFVCTHVKESQHWKSTLTVMWSDVIIFTFVETNTPRVSSLAVCHHGAPLLPPVKRRIPGNIGNSFVSFIYFFLFCKCWSLTSLQLYRAASHCFPPCCGFFVRETFAFWLHRFHSDYVNIFYFG